MRDQDGALLVGVDAGASKTIALAVTPVGGVIGRAAGDGANPKRHGLSVAADRIAGLVLEGSAGAGEGVRAGGEPVRPALVFVAGAGIDLPEHARALERELAERLPGTRVMAANDNLAVLRCGTPDGVGLAVPVSTGGNVIGRGPDGRVTDRGHGIFGGGYVLGALAARAALRGGGRGPAGEADGARATRSVDGPVPRDLSPALADAVEAAGLTWRRRRPEPAAAGLAAAVAAAAEAGDPYPARIVERWCGRVASAVEEEVARLRLGPTPCVVVFGGLLEASPWLGDRIRSAILAGAPGAHLRSIEAEPVEGAALLARDAWAGRLAPWEFTPRRPATARPELRRTIPR